MSGFVTCVFFAAVYVLRDCMLEGFVCVSAHLEVHSSVPSAYGVASANAVSSEGGLLAMEHTELPSKSLFSVAIRSQSLFLRPQFAKQGFLS